MSKVAVKGNTLGNAVFTIESPPTDSDRTFVLPDNEGTIITTADVGTIASQDSDNVSISGGTIAGITDLAVEDGGTGASNDSDARVNLGLGDVDNVSAADLRDRATHTGTQTLSTISDAGTIASQDADNVNIDGGTIDGTEVNATTLTASGDVNFDSGTLFVDASTNTVGIGTTSPSAALQIRGSNIGAALDLTSTYPSSGRSMRLVSISAGGLAVEDLTASGAERMRIDSSGVVLIGKTQATNIVTTDGIQINGVGGVFSTRTDALSFIAARQGTDGDLIDFYAQGIKEGSISVSGTTVSYNGGHLSRWSQLPDSTKDDSIVKGTVMSNLDEMAEWAHEDGATEDNEQLNRMKVSDVEGDPNVAGVFVNWDEDDEQFTADMNIAMTGDMVIRIAQGVTVQRGDLLMSAGDGTAKTQSDDIVRSKTIAKVTSTHVSHTYDDGSYLVPCVLMAC